MEISLRIKEKIAEITIEVEGATIKEDIVRYDSMGKSFIVDESFIENLLTIARDLVRFNKESDLDFVKKTMCFLNNTERKELIEWLLNS